MTDDSTLIARVLIGDTEAFRMLVEKYERVVYGYSRQLLRDSAEAEDVAQEVFVSAYRQLAGYQPGRSPFSTWLLALTRNHCWNALRSRRRRENRAGPPPAPVEAPDRAVEDGEVWEQFDRALATLPVEQRSAFVLAEIEELPYAEIALIEGIGLGTVKSRVSRAKARLRSALKSWRAAADPPRPAAPRSTP